MSSPGRRSTDFISGVRRRFAPSAETGAASLWPLPLAAGVVATAVGAALARWRPGQGGRVGQLAWPGGRETAVSMLQTVPTAVMTATAVTFSLMVVALQMSSQQFSPRLLRQFSRDRTFKGVLVVLVATFALPVTVLRSLSDDEDVPRLAMFVTFVLALASLGALIVFIAHMARALRVDTMMVTIHAETSRGIGEIYPEGSADVRLEELPLPDGDGVVVPSQRSGFVRMIDTSRLVEQARRHDLVVKLEVRPGDHVVRGTPIAVVWGARDIRMDTLGELVHSGLPMSYERTLEQDPSFGFRELTDIAVKALSPALNDPVTADHAIGHMSDLIVQISQRRLGPIAHRDDDDEVRLIAVDRDYRYYLDLPCGQIRRFGRHEPTVLLSLLRMLRDVGLQCQSEHHQDEVRRQVALILAIPGEEAGKDDLDALQDLADRVERALAGDELGAYRDRAGATRSM